MTAIDDLRATWKGFCEVECTSNEVMDADIERVAAEQTRLQGLVQELETRNIELTAQLTQHRRPRAPEVA